MSLRDKAIEYNQVYGFNILPLNNKVPCGDWVKWQSKKMKADDLFDISWLHVNGIGAVSGLNNLRCLDFDNVTDPAIVNSFLKSLELPDNYEWVVCSGSGKGYHIWFRCDGNDELFNVLGGEKSYYKLNCSQGCDHIELRWKKCQTVLPPSLHPSGNRYKFMFSRNGDLPENSPMLISADKLQSALNKYCELKSMNAWMHECMEEKKGINACNHAAMQPCNQTEKSMDVKGGMDVESGMDVKGGMGVCVYGCMEIKNIKERVNSTELMRVSEYLAGRIDNYDDWMRVGFALASLGEQGREYFIKISSNNPHYNDPAEELNKKFDGFLKDYRGDITTGTLFEIAKRYGYTNPPQKFWKAEEKNRIRIFSNLIIRFLKNEGFAKMNVYKDYIFIRSNDNIITEVTKINIKDHLLEYINNNSEGLEHELLEDYFIKNAGSLCSDSMLECLNTVNPALVSGTKEKEFFFFRNCFIEVNKDEIMKREYRELQGKIWEKQKAEHDFYFTKEKSEFETFIENICRKDQERINALRSAIGYLLVSYKDPSSAKAIIFIDEKLSDNAFGRSGKGLVSKAISQMKNVLKIDGKNFTFERSFMFQAVDQDTQLIIFDDVKKKFSFEKLFSILTEGITIEKKNKNEYRVPYERAPKILITTNHTVEGSDDSSIDRQFVVEFSDYYNAQFKPKDEFGHLFFDEWNEEQWVRFYNYMAGCCMYYLQNGLMSYKYVNLTRKKLIDSTSPEFEEFITELELDEEYNKKELFERFKKEYEDYGQIKQNTLSKWTKIYADLNDFALIERKSNGERYLRFERKLKNKSKTNFSEIRKSEKVPPL